jgi:SNF2 family DNA or RNA helicase
MIIITYESLRGKQKWFENLPIYYAVLDEGHKIKNPRAQSTIALKKLDIENRLMLTGTPIQNTIEELWCLIDFIQPGKLSSLEIFRDEYCSHILKAGSNNATTIEIALAKE